MDALSLRSDVIGAINILYMQVYSLLCFLVNEHLHSAFVFATALGFTSCTAH